MDAAYALVVQAVDGDAGKDANTAQMIKEGLAGPGQDLRQAPKAERVEALKKIESSAFFQNHARENSAASLRQPIAYAYFGYEGEAFLKALSFFRGFTTCAGCRKWRPKKWSDAHWGLTAGGERWPASSSKDDSAVVIIGSGGRRRHAGARADFSANQGRWCWRPKAANRRQNFRRSPEKLSCN